MKKDDKVIFHNTRLLLEHYRNVVWSLEVSVFQTNALLPIQQKYNALNQEQRYQFRKLCRTFVNGMNILRKLSVCLISRCIMNTSSAPTWRK